MTERDTTRRLAARLRAWDPAERLGAPGDDEVAAVRSALRREAARRPTAEGRPPTPGWLAAAAAAGLLALALGLGLRGPASAPHRADPRIAAAPPADPRPVRLEMTASNGVRIYWAIQRSPAARGDRS